MPNGFVPYLLMQNKQVFQGITPSQKLTPKGYLGMLLQNTTPNVVSSSISNGSGHVRDVKIKYRPRIPTGKSVTADNCSVQLQPSYKETSIPALSFRKLGIFFDYEQIRKYEEEASRTVAVGQPMLPNGIMMDMYDQLIQTANGLLGDVNNDLLAAQAAAFGKNVTNGLNTAKTVNFPLSTASNPLNQGLTMLMSDFMQNEIAMGNVVIVGDGLINNAYLQMRLQTQNAGDQRYPASVPPFFYDPATTAAWGANHFGVFERNAVQLVNINKFNGFVAGDKMSTFLTTLQLPLVDSLGGTQLSGFKFDMQVRHIDCPQELAIGTDGAGDPIMVNVDRGWVVDLMCNFGQFNIASDAYETTDRLTGNNGTLRYTASNT